MKNKTPLETPLLVILLGPPGSGKGTHAPFLSQALGLPHISTGDLFRAQIRNKTPIGVLAQGYIDQGKLVPDRVVVDMQLERLRHSDAARGAILDGFPRTIAQAEMLTQVFGASHQWIVLSLNIIEDIVVDRICGRLVCQNCSRVFHKLYAPPTKPSTCDACGSALYQRSDDNEGVVRERLSAYYRQTEPLLEYFQNSLKVIDAAQSKEAVAKDLLQACLLETSVV